MATKRKTHIKIDNDIISEPKASSPVNRVFIRNLIIVIIIGIGIFLVTKKYRGLVIAGTVNTTPISRFQLNQKLNERYGQATLEEMINAALLKDLVRQNGITIGADDLKKERDIVIERVGGEDALKTALEQYGMTETDLTERIESVLMEKKLAEKVFPTEVTDAEADQYFKENKASFEGKTFDEVKEEIVTALKEQKQQQQFADWFKGQKDKAQIQTYI
jgi:foldase protein PrsA